MQDIFKNIYEKNIWGSSESCSGSGSTLVETVNLRYNLLKVFETYSVKSMVDVPCGDWNWMSQVNIDGIDYVGGDIVTEIVQNNRQKYPQVRFETMDVTRFVPKADLVFVRDCFVHFPFEMISRAAQAIRNSGSKLIMTTNFPSDAENYDLSETGQWRPLDFSKAPFHLPQPLYVVSEGRYRKTMSLWSVYDFTF